MTKSRVPVNNKIPGTSFFSSGFFSLFSENKYALEWNWRCAVSPIIVLDHLTKRTC